MIGNIYSGPLSFIFFKLVSILHIETLLFCQLKQTQYVSNGALLICQLTAICQFSRSANKKPNTLCANPITVFL